MSFKSATLFLSVLPFAFALHKTHTKFPYPTLHRKSLKLLDLHKLHNYFQGGLNDIWWLKFPEDETTKRNFMVCLEALIFFIFIDFRTVQLVFIAPLISQKLFPFQHNLRTNLKVLKQYLMYFFTSKIICIYSHNNSFILSSFLISTTYYLQFTILPER